MNDARLTFRNPGRSIPYVLLSGFAWGLVVTTFESLTQPPLELSLSEYLNFYSRILLHYGAGGMLLAWLTALIANSKRPLPVWLTVMPALAAAMVAALAIDRLSILYVPWWHDGVMGAAMMPRLSELAPHVGWIFGVYGGLYVATFFFLRNEAETHDRLRQSELARMTTEAQADRALAEHRLPAVTPDLLLRALSELAQRFDEDHGRADRLLDTLVRLLRSASSLAANRSDKSDLRREIELASSFGRLSRELGLPGLTIKIDHEVDPAIVPCPPGLLARLPMALCSARTADGPVSMEISNSGDALQILLRTNLPKARRKRLASSLDTLRTGLSAAGIPNSRIQWIEPSGLDGAQSATLQILLPGQCPPSNGACVRQEQEADHEGAENR